MDTALRHRVNAARVAVGNQSEFFDRQRGQVASEWKADETRVTFADFAISEKLLSELRQSFPADQFFSEESGPLDEIVPVESRYTWILDPIDGTNNYALGISTCAISLALLKQGRPVYGLIYDGSTGELIEGGPGQGIRINGRKHVPTGKEKGDEARIIALHFPLPANRAGLLADLLETTRVRSLGSAALHLAYVALGRVDGAIDENIHIWDIAGAVALMEASGKPIRYLSGDPFPVRSLTRQGAMLRYVAGSQSFIESVENWLG